MTDERTAMTCPVPLPPDLATLIEGRRWTAEPAGESGAAVFRLSAHDRPTLYLKHGQGRFADDVADEAARLRWLAGRLPVPAVRLFVATPDAAWLLTDALPGRTADALLEDAPERLGEVVPAIARFLRRLHALPVDDCPFEAGHRLRLRHARRNLDAGLVDADDFADAHRGWTPLAVWEAMTALLPFAETRVVTHGDWSLGNMLVADGVVTGCIDVGRLGVADAYQDLAIILANLAEFGPQWQAAFLAAYGDGAPDARKLRFHHMLDEFF